MTAPTPVSSLVHSSTLVTAGIFLIIRLNLFFSSYYFFIFVIFFGLFTIGLGGLLAIIEYDLKKVIAFSTLSQLGLLVFILRFGELNICFFHLLSHAIFKSFLFIICGIFISLRFGIQDGRLIGLKFFRRGLFVLIILFSCLNLRGFPLTMGFLSKDLLLESFMGGFINIFMIVLFIIFCCFTVCYSLKLFFFIIIFIKSGFSFFKYESFFDSKF